MGALTEQNASHNGVRIIPVRVFNIAKAQHVQLYIPCTASGIDGKQYRPCNQAPCKTSGTKNSQKPEEKIAVDRRMI